MTVNLNNFKILEIDNVTYKMFTLHCVGCEHPLSILLMGDYTPTILQIKCNNNLCRTINYIEFKN